jgi:hypothetical protein
VICGSIVYTKPNGGEAGTWLVTCDADVRLKLKRNFPNANQRAAETIGLSDNEENSHDLLWFIQRYPMQMSVKDLRRLKTRAAEHKRTQSLMDALLAARRPPEHFELAEPAREYQAVAAQVAMLYGGLLLTDVFGLGKSLSSALPMTRAQYLPALVVTQTHLPGQWLEKTFQRFLPQLKVHIIKSSLPYDLIPQPKKRKGQSELFVEDAPRLPDVFIISYSKLSGWADIFAGLVRYVVFDEAQELRRDESAKYAAAKFIASKAELVMGLTATPIYNFGIEFRNVLECIRPGALGTQPEFVCEWCEDGKTIKDPVAFGAYLRREGLMLRRTREEVGRELPRAAHIPVTIECDPLALESIRSSAAALARTIMGSLQSFRGEKFQAAKTFDLLLRQATGIAKAPYAAQFIRMLLETEQKVVVFAWHRQVWDLLLEALEEFKPVLYSGTESAKQKDASRRAFVEGDSRVIGISLRSGAGLDGLQAVSSVCVFAELDWSPGIHAQGVGRLERDDQIQRAVGYYLVSDQGSDPDMMAVLGIKKDQLEGVIDPNADLAQLQTDPDRVRKMAENYLKRLGEPFELPEELAA